MGVCFVCARCWGGDTPRSVLVMSCREGTRQVWFKSLVATVVTALGVSHLAVTTLVWVTGAKVPHVSFAPG